MAVARLPNPLNQALANRKCLRFRVNWGFKSNVALDIISDTWDKSKLSYQKIVEFISRMCSLSAFMFKKTDIPWNVMINHGFVACDFLVSVDLNIFLSW